MNFTLQYSWSHDSFVGHTVKSRAPINNILYNLIGDALGNSSYILDFPLGGSTYIVGNSLYKVKATNPSASENMMLWRDVTDNNSGDPEYGTPNEDLHFINNTMIDFNGAPSSFVTVSCFNASSDTCSVPTAGPVLTVPAVVENNIFIGSATEATNQPSAFVQNNILLPNTQANIDSMKFNDPADYDFRLLAGSPAIGAGIYPPTDNTGTADPKALAVYEYVNPVNMTARPTPTGTTMDDGAFHYGGAITPPNITLNYTQTLTSPNTGTITITGLPVPTAGQYNYAAFVSHNTGAIPAPTSIASATGTITTSFTVNPVGSTTVVPITIYVGGTILTANVTVNPGAAVLTGITLDNNYYPQMTIQFSGPPTCPAVFQLTSSDPSTLYAPATVTLPANKVTVEAGTLNGSNYGQTPSSKPATLTATYNGVTKTLTANVYAVGIHNFYCGSSCSVVGGKTVGLTIVLAGNTPYGGATATISSNNPTVVPTQTFNYAQDLNEFTANLATNAVTTTTNVNVTLNYNGALWGLTLSVTPPGGDVASKIAVIQGNNQSSAVGTAFGTPLAVEVTDSAGNPVANQTVTFSGTGITFSGSYSTNYPGGATAVTGPLGKGTVTVTPNVSGPVTVTATVAGVSTPAVFSETATGGTSSTLSAVSGSGQSSAVGSPFANPLVVLVKNSSGTAASGVVVTFAGTGVSFPAGATATTSSSGQASVTAQPTTTGAITVSATVSGGSSPATFTETGTAAAPASIAGVSGSGQTGAIGKAFTNPLIVAVKDANGNPVSGATVTFAGTGASFPAGATATTNASGDAQATAQPTTVGAITITASVSGVTTPASFSETGTVGAPASILAIAGSGQTGKLKKPFANSLVVLVEDAYSHPVPGATVTFAGAGVGFSSGGIATTDSSGAAEIDATPLQVGALTITASVAGVSTPATFSEIGQHGNGKGGPGGNGPGGNGSDNGTGQGGTGNGGPGPR